MDDGFARETNDRGGDVASADDPFPGVPLVASDEEPPRGFVPIGRDFELRAWRGTARWRTVHGEAQVLHLLGRPVQVVGARGNHGETLPPLSTVSPNVRDQWRHATPSGSYVHGTVEFARDGVSFAPIARAAPRVRYSDGTADLRDDLLASPGFRDRLRDRDFAMAVYLLFVNETYARDDARFGMSWRAAAGFVADARDLGESYVDFYLSEPCDMGEGADPRTLNEEALGYVERAGWRLRDAAGSARDHARALDMAKEASSRAAATHDSSWMDGFEGLEERATKARADMEAGTCSTSDMAYWACRTGRMSRAEWTAFWGLYDFEDGAKAPQ